MLHSIPTWFMNISSIRLSEATTATNTRRTPNKPTTSLVSTLVGARCAHPHSHLAVSGEGGPPQWDNLQRWYKCS